MTVSVTAINVDDRIYLMLIVMYTELTEAGKDLQQYEESGKSAQMHKLSNLHC